MTTAALSTDWLATMPDVVARLESIRRPRMAHVGVSGPPAPR